MGKKNYTGNWKNVEGDTRLGKRQFWQRNRWDEKGRAEGQTWDWKEVSEEPMLHWQNNSCLLKECFCQMKSSKAKKLLIKTACVTLAQSSLGYFYHSSQISNCLLSWHFMKIKEITKRLNKT